MQGTVLVYFIFLWCSAALAHPAQVDETHRETGGPLSQIRRDRSHLGVRSGQCSFWGLEHAWLGLSVRATKIHLWKCPWRSAWMEEERNRDLQFITSRSPEKKSNSSFFVADARLHQHEHTSPSRSSQLPASFVRPLQVRQKKNHSKFTIRVFCLHLELGLRFALWRRKFCHFGVWSFWSFCILHIYLLFQCPSLATVLRICFSQVAFLAAVMALESFLHLQIFQSVSPAQPFLQATGRGWGSECHLLPLAQVRTHAIHSSAGREEIVAITAVVQCEILSASFFASPGKRNILGVKKQGGRLTYCRFLWFFFFPTYRAAVGKDETYVSWLLLFWL